MLQTRATLKRSPLWRLGSGLPIDPLSVNPESLKPYKRRDTRVWGRSHRRTYRALCVMSAAIRQSRFGAVG